MCDRGKSQQATRKVVLVLLVPFRSLRSAFRKIRKSRVVELNTNKTVATTSVSPTPSLTLTTLEKNNEVIVNIIEPPLPPQNVVWGIAIADTSVYTTGQDNLEDDNLVEPKVPIFVDGTSVLSFLESAQCAYNELNPEKREQYAHYVDKVMNEMIPGTPDGKSYLSTMDPSMLSVYSMDQFYPDDDEVFDYHTSIAQSEEKNEYDMSLYGTTLYSVDDDDYPIKTAQSGNQRIQF
jgi:hypothetical protein